MEQSQLSNETTDSYSNGNVAEATKTIIEIDPNLEISIRSDSVDADGYVSLWNAASDSMGADLLRTRALAARFLGFLCKHQCDFVVASSSDASYLDERFERDNSLLYSWTAESENVDVMAQHAYVPAEHFKAFLKKRKFSAASNYSPKRADRVKWFKDEWCVG